MVPPAGMLPRGGAGPPSRWGYAKRIRGLGWRMGGVGQCAVVEPATGELVADGQPERRPLLFHREKQNKHGFTVKQLN